MKIVFKDSTELQLVHPVTDELLVTEDKGLPMLVEIFGKHTDIYKNALNKLLKASQKRGKKQTDLMDAQKQGLDLLCDCIGGFKNLEIETENGKLDPSNIRSVLEDCFWIKEQIDSAIMDLEAFTDNSKKT
jgi:hypothetical protein